MKNVILAVLFLFAVGCGSDPCADYCNTLCDAFAQCGVEVTDCSGECLIVTTESTDRICDEGREATDKATCVEMREVARALGWL